MSTNGKGGAQGKPVGIAALQALASEIGAHRPPGVDCQTCLVWAYMCGMVQAFSMMETQAPYGREIYQTLQEYFGGHLHQGWVSVVK